MALYTRDVIYMDTKVIHRAMCIKMNTYDLLEYLYVRKLLICTVNINMYGNINEILIKILLKY